jgi:predicted HD phosphohydrolase
MAKEGWKWIINSTREHYFVEGRSLCKRWLSLSGGGFDTTIGNKPCKTCEKALAKRTEKALLKKADFEIQLVKGKL